MKPGLRLQILVLLGALLALGFVPLHFAVEAYVEVGLAQSRSESQRALGETIAEQLLAPEARSAARLEAALERHVERGTVLAIAVYDAAGNREASRGRDGAAEALPETFATALPASRELHFGDRLVTLLVVQEPRGGVGLVLPSTAARAELLSRLLALYIGLIALLLLAAAYLTLTRWIITPVAELSRTAQRVAATTRPFEPPITRSRELSELAESLRVMTEKLLAEEQALRRQVVEVERATAKLKETQAQLVRSERLASVGQLAAGLAHEVGNPIAAMRGLQDLILTGDLTQEEQADFVQRMRKETERIHRILRDLLDFARPSSSEELHEPGSVEVAVHETTTLLLPQPVLRDVELLIDVFPELPPVRLRQERLTQVLLNLLLNAAAACRDGGRVRVRATRDGEHVRLSVEDDGPGVPEALADRIFEPFVSSKDVGEGSGLGLSVCRGLVESVGGSIRLDRSRSAGACFVVLLPIAEAPASEPAPERHDAETTLADARERGPRE